VTLSRTVTLVLAAMALAGLWVRRDLMVKLWPVVFLLPALIHFAAPGVLGTIVHSFNPYGGLTTAESQRAGLVGSGRLADLNPGLHMFAKSPIFGIGIGALSPTGASAQQAAPVGVVSLSAPASGSGATSSVASNAAQQAAGSGLPTIIFDDQYMNTLVSIGLVGLFAVIWFIWGVFFDLGRAARKVRKVGGDRRPGELLAATAVACGGFCIGMATLDAFSFVQATLIFYVIAAIGLRVRALTSAQ
jgi:O-antigen ligase